MEPRPTPNEENKNKRMKIDIEKELGKAKEYFIIVEGKKDKRALEELGFRNIFIIHETGKSIYEKIEQIEKLTEKKKICILTDFDKKGKKLYLLLKSELSKRKVHLDNSLRGILLKQKISHIEGLASFMKSRERRFLITTKIKTFEE